ncbi:MAG: 2Fe-2S iron-sulfur cluster-binding protein [Pirellulales bacterium]
MALVIIDGTEIEVADHERLNGIQAARRVGVEIPHYCWHPGLTVVASCRMCLVETGTRAADGKLSMLPKLVPACQTPAKDGTVFVTNSEKVQQARAMVEEDLLIDHPIDCPICDKAGECLLQDYHFEHGQGERRADLKPFTSRRREMGPTVTLFVDRCVMCSRCVRFTREISGDAELMVINRGSHEEIDVFPGYPLDNKLSGNVVDLCPVGALGDKDFLYKQRVWFMKKHEGVCASCSTGCSVWIEENQDAVYRLKPRENPLINQWWMCDEGRYSYGYIHSQERRLEPRRREAGGYINLEWPAAPRELESRLREVVGGENGGRLAIVVSPYQTVEEAYLLCKLAREIDSNAALAMGPVPVIGEDERFKNGFVIHAEKCPNRKGVEAVVAHFGDGVKLWDDFLAELEAGGFAAVWVAAGYRMPWIDEATAARFDGVELLIVQDLFDSPLWQRATYQLPGGGYAERSGSYVNYQDRLQFFKWAVRPPAGAKVEGYLYWQMLGMRGLYNARHVLNEVAGEIPYFAVAMDPVPPTGVDLKINLLAAAT